MSKKNQHVVPLGTGWAVKDETSKDFTVITTTKRQAVDTARKIARNNRAELIIHGRDGRIQDKDSYGNDPHPPKDKKH